MNPVKLGLSIAASWAWGNSVVIGMQVAQTKGWAPFCIWAAANTLTLVLFGELTRRGIVTRETFDRPFVKWFALFIQSCILVLQLLIIYSVSLPITGSREISIALASSVGLFFVLIMYGKGLPLSILTDRFQWYALMIILVCCLGTGIYEGVSSYDIPLLTTNDNLLWALYSACILLSGPLGDVQHWQRADVARESRAFLWGALFFGIYMVMVGLLATMKFNQAMNWLLLGTIICLTSSTIDSVAVALHEVVNKKVGTAVAVLLCLSWWKLADFGIVELWSYIGVPRIAFALCILGISLAVLKGKRR